MNTRDPRSTPLNVTLPEDSDIRKLLPMARGLLDYFPLALAYVSFVSLIGNIKHDPEHPDDIHWSRGKSNDQADTIVRHIAERGMIGPEGLRHSGSAAWRTLAMLELELESLPAGALDEEMKNALQMWTHRDSAQQRQGRAASSGEVHGAAQAHPVPGSSAGSDNR